MKESTGGRGWGGPDGRVGRRRLRLGEPVEVIALKKERGRLLFLVGGGLSRSGVTC